MRPSVLLHALALGAAAFIGAAAFALALERPAAMDFAPLYAAGRLVATGHGASILDPEAIRGVERDAGVDGAIDLFVHPPAVALLIAPLGALPFGVAFSAMAAIDAALVAFALALLASRSGARPLSLVLLFVAPASTFAIAHGQTSPIVLLLVALAARAGPGPAGVMLGLTALRPQTAPLFVLAGLARRETRVWTLLGAGAVALGSLVVVGLDGVVRYVALLLSAAEWSRTGAYGLGASIGWSGLLVPAGLGTLALGLSAVSLVAGAVVVMRAASADRPRVAASWSLIASPHTLMHDAVLMYPALLALLRTAPVDALAALTWALHAAVAPIGVLWSLVIAVATVRRGDR